MKTIITIALALTTYFLNAQVKTFHTTNGKDITVTVPVNSNEGTIMLGLYNEKTFMKAAPIAGLSSEIENGKAVAIFKNVPPGTYAISIFHDKNNNKMMDFEANGMPKENYGVSNNVMSMGPPQWNDAKFEVTNQNITMEIRM